MHKLVNLIPVVCLAVLAGLAYTNLSGMDDVVTYDAPTITVSIETPSK